MICLYIVADTQCKVKGGFAHIQGEIARRGSKSRSVNDIVTKEKPPPVWGSGLYRQICVRSVRECREIGNQVRPVFGVGQTRKTHRRARRPSTRVFDELVKVLDSPDVSNLI